MKRVITILLLLSSINLVNAQFTDNNAIYSSAEINLGNYFGGDLNLNYVLKEKYSFKLGYTGNLRRPKSQPEDFTSGVIGILVAGSSNPVDQFENFGVSIGRIYKLNQQGTIRANLSLGVGYTLYTEPLNWKKIDNSAVSVYKNYSYDYVEHSAVSLMVNPKIVDP